MKFERKSPSARTTLSPIQMFPEDFWRVTSKSHCDRAFFSQRLEMPGITLLCVPDADAALATLRMVDSIAKAESGGNSSVPSQARVLRSKFTLQLMRRNVMEILDVFQRSSSWAVPELKGDRKSSCSISEWCELVQSDPMFWKRQTSVIIVSYGFSEALLSSGFVSLKSDLAVAVRRTPPLTKRWLRNELRSREIRVEVSPELNDVLDYIVREVSTACSGDWRAQNYIASKLHSTRLDNGSVQYMLSLSRQSAAIIRRMISNRVEKLKLYAPWSYGVSQQQVSIHNLTLLQNHAINMSGLWTLAPEGEDLVWVPMGVAKSAIKGLIESMEHNVDSGSVENCAGTPWKVVGAGVWLRSEGNEAVVEVKFHNGEPQEWVLEDCDLREARLAQGDCFEVRVRASGRLSEIGFAKLSWPVANSWQEALGAARRIIAKARSK